MKLEGSGWYAAPNDLYGRGLTPYEIAVLGYLYRRAGPDGESFPSNATVARDCKMSRRQVQITLSGLVRLGYVLKETRTDTRGRTSSNVYRLASPQPVEGRVQEVHPPIAPGAPSPVHVVHPRSTEVPRTDEVHSVKGGRIAGPRDSALQTAKQFISGMAYGLARGAAERFGWPPTAFRLSSEARLAQQLLDVGISVGFLTAEINRREKLGSFAWLHRDLDLRRLQQTSDETERAKLIEELVQNWGVPKEDARADS